MLQTLLLLVLSGDERLLLAAENQIVEIDRAGKVTELWKPNGHRGIWDAWRLPDGGISYVHSGGLVVLDRRRNVVLEHAAARAGELSASPGGAVLENGRRFAILDSVANEIRVLDRKGRVRSRTPLPKLEMDAFAARHRMLRASARGGAFWVAQYQRNAVLEVREKTGEILRSLNLNGHVRPSPLHRAFATLEPGDGTVYATTATGLELLRFDAAGRKLSSWTASELGLRTRYFLGMQSLPNGNLLLALGDYHLRAVSEATDLLAEIAPGGNVVWKLTREQLENQIDGHMEPKTRLEEMRVANVHLYDASQPNRTLRVRR